MLKNGDEVYTSGDGNRYPRGLLVGTVVKAKDNNIVIKTSLQMGKLDYVQILNWNALSKGIDIKVENIN